MQKEPKNVCILNLRAPGFENLYSVGNSYAVFVTIDVVIAKELPFLLLSVTLNSRDFFGRFSIANKPKALVFPSKWRLRSVDCL